jgi:hypothetical protein
MAVDCTLPIMNLYWVYDIPNWLFATLTIASFVTFSMIGLPLTRWLILKFVGNHPHNDVVSFYLASVGVFYGITLGLIAVGTYTTYSDTDHGVSEEAASVAAIYRDVSSYPEPARSQLRAEVEGYTRFVIEEEWPQQKEGIVPPQAAEHVNKLQAVLDEFNPATEREKTVHAETLRQFNRLVELSGLRLQSVTSGLPSTMYGVIVIGAILNLVVSWFFVVENARLHSWLNVVMAALLGLLVFLIAAMDNPFRGEFSVGPDAFEVVRSQLMKPALVAPPVRPAP